MYAQPSDLDAMIDPAIMGPPDPLMSIYPDPMLITDVQTVSTPPHQLPPEHSIIQHFGMDPNLDPALMNPVIYEPLPELGSEPIPTGLPDLRTVVIGTPDLDNSYSPITTGSGDGGAKIEPDESEVKPIQTKVAQSIETQDKPRRPSTAAATSPQEDVTTPSRRSSSRTSSTTHHSTIVVSADRASPRKTPSSVRKVLQAQEHTEDDDAIDADPSEKLARDLQAQEHGLRRRPSVRIS